MCVKLFITSQCPNKSGIKIERREAHQLQSHNSAQSCSNLMWSRTEASSAVVRAAEPSWELCVWACVSPCENRHWEKVKLLFGWRCMRYLSPYPLSPVLTPCPTSQPSPHSHSPPTLHSHLLWHERGTDAKSSHTTNSVLKKNEWINIYLEEFLWNFAILSKCSLLVYFHWVLRNDRCAPV